MFAPRRIVATGWIAAVLLAGTAALAQSTTTATAPATAPATGKPAATEPGEAKPAEAAPAPATSKPAATQPGEAKPPEAAPAPADVRFHFKDESYRDVIRFISRMVDKPVLGDINAVQGTLTYFDAKPYTRSEAMAIVNQVLRMKGFTLMDAGRYLKLLPISAIPRQADLPVIRNGEFQATRRDGEEIVTAILPLQFIDASQAVSLAARMVNSFGSLSPLGKGQGIIITDTVANIRRIQQLLTVIDKGTQAEESLVYYPLKIAPAADVARLVEQLFAAPLRGRRRFVFNRQTNRYDQVPVQQTETITVTHDARSNTVIVVASPEKHRMIEETIKHLDVPRPAGEGGVQIVQLKNAKAEDLAKVLSAASGSRAIPYTDSRGRRQIRTVPAARIVPEPGTNRLIISAEPELMKQLQTMIETLDDEAVRDAGVRIIPLKVANAASLVGVIQNAFATRDARGRPKVSFSITAESRTNSLVIRGPAADLEAVDKLVKQLDRKTETEREIHVVRLKAGDAGQLAAALNRLLSQQRGRGKGQDQTVRVEADAGTNSLLITAAPGDWERIKGLLDELTKETEEVTASTRIFQLQHAKAADLSPVLQRIFASRQGRAQRGRPAPIPTIVIHDVPSNTLVVSATGENLTEIERLLATMDVPAKQAAKVQVRTYALTNADASALARSLGQLFAAGRGRAGEPQPRFQAEQPTNQLVVAATAEQFEMIDELVQRLQKDAAANKPVVKLFRLEHAKAAELAPAVQRIIQAEIAAEQRRSASRSGRSDFQVSVDARTNSLMITAPAETMAVIEKLMPSLDAAADDAAVQITKVIELENADPAELANALNAALAGQAAPPGGRGRGRRPMPVNVSGLKGRDVRVVAAPSARAVLLTGETEDVAFAEQIVKQIDQRPSTDQVVVRTFRIQHGKAEDLAAVLGPTLGQIGRRGRGAVPTRITADKNANTLVVSAAGSVVEQVEKVLKDLDVETALEGAPTIEIVQLKNAKADQLAAALNAAQGADPRRRGRATEADEVVRVTADAASNSLLLTGRPTQIEETKKLIVQLDETSAELTSETRIFQLTQAKASELAPVLEKILLGQLGGRGGRGRQPSDIRIAAQDKANAVVVHGPPEAIALAQQIVKEFDAEGAAETVIEIVQLANAEATVLATAVNQALAGQADPKRRQRGEPAGAVVVPEGNSNSVLVHGNRLDVQRAVLLIKQLDAGGRGVGAQVRVFPLQHAEAPVVAKTLELLFRQILAQQRQRAGRGAAPAESFSVAADERTNSLIVSASASNFATVEALLTKLDSDAEVAIRDVRYIPLFSAAAAEMVDKIDAMFADRKKGERPTVQADEFANGLTVIAKDADYRAIEAVVAKLDEAAEPSYVQVRVIPLSGDVKAEDLAKALKRVFEQVSDAEVQITDRLPKRPTGGGEELFWPAPEDPGAAAPAAGEPKAAPTAPQTKPGPEAPPATQPADAAQPAAFEPPVIVAVDKESNSLIISAGWEDMEEIESLIFTLTTSDIAGEAKIKVFKVKNADPAALVKTLNALFNPKATAPARAQQQRGRQQQQQRGRPQPQPAPAAKPRVTIAADVRTKSIIVRAKPVELDLIGQLIEELDQAPVVVSTVQIFQLKNTDAAEVANNLKQLFSPTRVAVPAAKGAQAKNQEQIKRMLELQQARGDVSLGITVSANRMTNSVIVAAAPEAMELVAKLIEELDQAPAAGGLAVRMFKIKNAEVADVVEAVSRIFARSTRAQRRTGQAAAPTGAVVTGNESTRMVIVSARADEFPLIEQVVTELDAAGAAETAVVKVYRLQYGEARSVADALSRTLLQAAAAGGRGRGRQRTPTATAAATRISPEAASNSIVVRASETEHQQIAKLIAEMDQSTQAAGFHTIRLANTDARDVANALGRLIGSWPRKRDQPRAAVAFNVSTNTLMVSGTQEHIDTITKIVEQLETGKVDRVQVQFIQLTHAAAPDAVRALSPFFGPRAADPANRTVTLTADDRSNALLVAAKPDQFAAISALIGKLDVPEALGESRQVVIALEHATADAVARAITQAFAPQRGLRVRPEDLVTAAAEPATNTLIISASEKNLQKVQALIKEIDVETAGGRKTEFVILQHAKAAELARVLGQVVRRTGRGRGAEEPPTVSGDATTNALIFRGKKSDLDELMAMALQLDQAALKKTTEVHIVPLKSANAVAVAEMVRQLYREEAAAARQLRQSVEPLAVSADADANAVVLAAPEAQYKRFAKLINEIDEMSPGRANLRLIQLKNADPAEVLKAIQQLFGSGANGQVTRPGPGRAASRAGGPEASVLAGQRALLVNASDKDWEAIKQLVEALDKAAEESKRQVMVFPLAKAANNRVAQALNNTYRAAARSGHPEDIVSATPLVGTNAIVVTAVKEKMEEVAALIKTLDAAEIAGERDIRIFALENASATQVLPVLRTMIRPIQQARPNQPIELTADQRANVIIISTQAPVTEEIARLIKTLDALPAVKAADILAIPLKNADAPTLASVLTDMLTPGTSAILTPEARALQEQIRLLRLQQGQEGIGPLDLTKPIKITADPPQRGQQGSNTLIMSSTAENLTALGEIVKLLDTLPIAEAVRVQIVHLKNCDAISLMQLLREVFTQGRQLAGQPGTAAVGRARPQGPAGVALTGTLNVTADARTNALVLAGTDEALVLAGVLVKDLDRQPISEFTEVRVYKLAHADAARLAPLIEQVFAEEPVPAAAAGVAGARTYVTRLKMTRQKDRPVSAKVARSHPTLIVRAETNANLLIVAARSDLLGIVGELVAQMDVPGAGSMTVARIYPLANADASRMSQVIQGLYTGPNAALIRPEDKPTITVDTRTNSLVISASEKTYAMIDAVLKKLDAKLPIDLRDIRLIPLQNADAATLAPTLQQMMDARVQRQQSLGVGDAEALRMIVVPDARSNFLIVGGSAEGFKLVQDLAKRLDEAAPALAGQIQLIGLTNANAGTLSATLNNLFDQRYQAARTPDVQRQKPVIVPDLRINVLMVSANQDDSKVIQSLVAKLDARPAQPAVELVVIPMKFNDAGAIGPMIQRIFADRLQAMTPPGQQVAPQDVVSVDTDALSNALVISASKENLVYIRDLLAKVDVEPPVDTGVVRMFPLTHADVARVASMLQSLIQQGLYKPGLISAAGNAIAQAREKVAITSDLRTNVLIVSASKENLAVIEQIIRTVDVKDTWGLAGNVKLYMLKHADAARLGPALQQMFDRKRQAEAAVTPGTPPRSLPVVIIPDERTNTLLVAAGKEGFQEIDALIARLDVKDVVQTYDFRVFHLKQGSAASLEPVLRQLFAQRAARPGAAAVTIIADPKANTLIIGAEKDDLAIAESLIARLDTAPPPAGQVVRAFAIEKADAAELAKTLQQLYDATIPTGGKSGIAVTVDERSNSILVSAAAGDMAQVTDLIRKLDTAPVTNVTEIRIFTLRHADAAQLASVLTEALTNKPTPMTTASPNRATLLRLVAESPEGKKLTASAVKEGIMITPVPRTNSLLVQAPVETMPLLAKLISALDNTDPRMAEIRVFTLVNADAAQMARVLNELFRLQLANTQRQAARYTISTTQPAAAAATLGSAEQTACSITVDYRTNSLVVGGTREYVELVGRVIQDLDASPAEDRQTMCYRLRHAQATDLQTALSQLLDQERQRVVSTLGNDAVGAAKELLAREVAIVAEGSSNTLLISGSPRFFKVVAAMVEQLDRAPPQVLVQVLLAEVTLDDSTEFGVDWTYSGRPSGRTVSFGPVFGVGTGDGFTFTLATGDLALMLRALQKQDRLEVLSRPQIVAVDNQEATISIGERVPYPASSYVSETGVTRTNIDYEDVGIILVVTPRISPDGFVTMDVAPEISSLTESTVQISENLNARITSTRSATTTVTVQDGHTIVIGGLITKNAQNLEEKVPLLGDIPLLGALFKFSKVTQKRTELLIILTPRILRTPTQADVLSNKQIRGLGLSKGIHTEASIGELLNPLGEVTPLEVKRLEGGSPTSRPASDDSRPVMIPLRLPGNKPAGAVRLRSRTE